MSDGQHERFSRGWWFEPERAHRLAAVVFFVLGLGLLFAGIDDGQGEQILGSLALFGAWFWFAREANGYEADKAALRGGDASGETHSAGRAAERPFASPMFWAPFEVFGAA